MKQILLFFMFLHRAKYLDVHGVAAVGAENTDVNETLTHESPSQPKYIVQDPVKFMIRNVKSLLVLDGSEFEVKMAEQLGNATQKWTFTRSAIDPNFIIFKNFANGCALTSMPNTRSIFCSPWADTRFTMWKLNRDRRLVTAAYPQDKLTFEYGNMTVSLRADIQSDGTDEWVLVVSIKDNKISSG